jgi:hypothetical protein
MSYLNTGAYVSGSRPASKAALKRALLADPASLSFDKTAAFFNGEGTLTLADLEPGLKLTVTGPDPYVKRNWYATVELVNGKVRIT